VESGIIRGRLGGGRGGKEDDWWLMVIIMIMLVVNVGGRDDDDDVAGHDDDDVGDDDDVVVVILAWSGHRSLVEALLPHSEVDMTVDELMEWGETLQAMMMMIYDDLYSRQKGQGVVKPWLRLPPAVMMRMMRMMIMTMMVLPMMMTWRIGVARAAAYEEEQREAAATPHAHPTLPGSVHEVSADDLPPPPTSQGTAAMCRGW
jgi:hypothetical protein